MKNSADQGGCYSPKPKAGVGLQSSSYLTKAKFNFIQNIFKLLKEKMSSFLFLLTKNNTTSSPGLGFSIKSSKPCSMKILWVLKFADWPRSAKITGRRKKKIGKYITPQKLTPFSQIKNSAFPAELRFSCAASHSCSNGASAAACTDVVSILETSLNWTRKCDYYRLSLPHCVTVGHSFALVGRSRLVLHLLTLNPLCILTSVLTFILLSCKIIIDNIMVSSTQIFCYLNRESQKLVLPEILVISNRKNLFMQTTKNRQ